ncbi:hypothetical protein WS73_05565 [Burkholderia savannae]|nr:hypothetical protein WS73_05565 [Burkholderia savannae]
MVMTQASSSHMRRATGAPHAVSRAWTAPRSTVRQTRAIERGGDEAMRCPMAGRLALAIGQ